MAQATFVLKEPKSNEDTLVYLMFTFDSKRLKYSTGQKINPKYWNPEKQRAKDIKAFAESQKFNLLLNKIENAANNSFRKILLEDQTPTPELLRAAISEALNKQTGERKDLISFGVQVLEISDRKEGSKKAIRQSLRLLREFKEESRRSLHFDAIDLDFYDQFVDFLKKRNYGINTIGNQIKNVKVFMREAFERGLTKNLAFQSKRFRKVEEESETIYLSMHEVKQIYELDLSASPRLDKARDLFIIGCYTGLRFSDLASLSPESVVNEGSLIKLRTIKTGESVVVPLNNQVKTIPNKYGGLPPKVISNQKMNDFLKEIGEFAELNETVVITATKGGMRQTDTFKKWELITTHTARRSFATNAYLQGVPSISIMKITGHKTEKSFLKYIKISQEDNANKLIMHPFFA